MGKSHRPADSEAPWGGGLYNIQGASEGSLCPLLQYQIWRKQIIAHCVVYSYSRLAACRKGDPAVAKPLSSGTRSGEAASVAHAGNDYGTKPAERETSG